MVIQIHVKTQTVFFDNRLGVPLAYSHVNRNRGRTAGAGHCAVLEYQIGNLKMFAQSIADCFLMWMPAGI